MEAVVTEGLSRRFGQKTAVDALDLTIHAGELFALLGVNGAGKTTTIRMLTGLLVPSAGDALLLGDSVVTATEKVKQKTNVSPQETAVAENLSVRENLELIAGIYGFGNTATQKAQEVIDLFHMAKVAETRAKTLSGGWQRRLSIAMALISEPEILFLDEPTLGLDVLARRELWTIIEGLKGKITIVLTTHYLEEAEALSDRIGVMENGRLQAVGTVKELMELTKAATFEDAFVALAAREEELQ